MKKVFQQVISPNLGDCARAVMASLFDLELTEVPDFYESDEPQFVQIRNFFESNGYDCYCINPRPDEDFPLILRRDEGVNGYFFASVNSRTYENASHAVIIDEEMNIVHDPNPNLKCLGLDSKEITCVYLNKMAVNSLF